MVGNQEVQMKLKIRIAYELLFLLILVFMLYSAYTMRTDIVDYRDCQGVYTVTDYKSFWIDEDSLPAGGKDIIEFTLKDENAANTDITFFAVHQEIEMYIDDELVYSGKRGDKNPFGKTPGSFWASVRLNSDDIGKLIRFEITPAYKDVKGALPEIYIGDSKTILLEEFRNDIFIAIVAFVTFIVGMGFLIWVLYNKSNLSIDTRLFYLACFAVFIGLWKLTDLRIIPLLIDNPVLVSYMPLLSLALVIVPFTLFMGELFKDDKKWKYNALCIASLVYGFVIVVLQMFNITDVRELLTINHGLMAILILLGISGSIITIVKNGWTMTIKLNTFCILLCFMGTVADLLLFYKVKAKIVSCFGIVALLIYIIVLGFESIKESRRLINEGKKAQKYQNIAFHDQLTTLYSRSAFVDYTKPEEFVPDGVIIVLCDLNNLKYCNDHFGHEAGDRYLIESAKVIKEVFEKCGRCFRMGGDEFAIIMRNKTVEECERYIGELRNKQAEYRKAHPEEFPIYIACGFAAFDGTVDHDINDTMRRADKRMYADKYRIKQTVGVDNR